MNHSPKRPFLPSRAGWPLVVLLVALIGFATYNVLEAWRIYDVFNQVEWGPGITSPMISEAQAITFNNARIPTGQIRDGGPGKDGIPALTNPEIVSATSADLKPSDRVIGISLNGESRAYPLRILNWHEAVNDTIGGAPIVATYCPLCDSAAVFDRRHGDEVMEFGISGLLYNSNVLLYDRQANDSQESLWSQVKLEAVTGPNAGAQLETLPSDLTTWSDWRAEHPETTTLSFDTGHRRDYERNPYGDYFTSPRLYFPVAPENDRLPLKTRVLGVLANGNAKAFVIDSFEGQSEFAATVGETKVNLRFDPEGETLKLAEPVPENIRTIYTFWFAWAAMHPDTEIARGNGPRP